MESLKSEYQLKGKALDEDLRRRQGEEQNKLLVKVQKAINTIAEKDQYDLVLQREQSFMLNLTLTSVAKWLKP